MGVQGNNPQLVCQETQHSLVEDCITGVPIDSGEGVVEQTDLRVVTGEERTSDGNPRFLTPGEVDSFLSNYE